MSIPFFILGVVFLTMYLSAEDNTAYLVIAVVFGVLAVTTAVRNKKGKDKENIEKGQKKR
ncbi:hypothetical protein [Salinicoccus sp. HZC-1]|uniref:hypothetical protein n=1 Tax=Salinicoccus sp. HZC-1 TaxID=3385497 RepID=UPI00398AA067